MEGVELVREENVFEYRFQDLRVRAVMGVFDEYLHSFSNRYRGPLEFAPVRDEPGREWLSGFHLEPPVDLTIVRLPNREVSVVAKGFEQSKICALLEVIVSEGVVINSPEESFVKGVGVEFQIDLRSLAQVNLVAAMLKVPREKVWGAVNYANFLEQFAGREEKTAMTEAFERYGLPKIQIYS